MKAVLFGIFFADVDKNGVFWELFKDLENSSLGYAAKMFLPKPF
jgi:hypothetical protein